MSSSTTSTLKPIKLYGNWGINPSKVAILLSELSVPYTIAPVAITEVKSEPYVSVNPNGRLPAIEDPNTGIVLWESGAILEYIVERYDTGAKLSFAAGQPAAWLARQWLHFQASGQGPYYGQAAWFKLFAPEPVPLAVARYAAEVNRVSGVIDGHLAREAEKQGEAGDGPWFVGGRVSFVDIAFVPWQEVAGQVLTKEEYDVDKYPHLKAWLQKMLARETVRSTLDKFSPKK
ncbi:glutathione S-transferase [Camillea tinctor]|nr:glutathione S-transferase [Camillea tinctor]